MGEDVESVMGGVRMGVNVDIKRTDGEYQPLLYSRHTCDQTSQDTVLLCSVTTDKGLVLRWFLEGRSIYPTTHIT